MIYGDELYGSDTYGGTNTVTAICKSSIKAKAIRVIRLDECGNPIAGTTGMAVSEGFVQVNLSPDIEDGEEFIVKNANGDLCINDKDAPRLKRYNVQIDLCQIDPDVIELMTGSRRITRAGTPATAIGLGIGETDSTVNGGFSLEVWSKVAGGQCGDAGDKYYQWVLPWVRNAILGDITLENGPLTLTINADTLGNANYGTGPLDQFAVALDADEHLAFQLTSDTPPVGVCGYQTLVLS